MNSDQKILKVAIELVQALNKQADNMLPAEIADVVKTHSMLAVGAAWVPVPGADIAAAAATIWGMYARINKKIGLPFSENLLKSIASGVATNLASYAVGMGAASLLKFIPGIGTIGSAIAMSGVIYACTLVSGYVYLKALLLLAKKGNGNISSANLSDAIKEVLKDQSTIKNLMNEAKGDYKK
ncbi:MAG: hypothetical protein IKQ48_05420 [Paludibacteraceae bacterium]|nr:hypothetical protein [Paludibacteraceae bacterium]